MSNFNHVLSLLAEGINSDIKKIAQMTDDNDHTGATIAVAYLVLKYDDSVKNDILTLRQIKAERDKGRGLDPAAAGKRDKIFNKLMGIAKKNLTPEQYKALDNAL